MALVRTDSKNADFKSLVQLLDSELAVRDGEDHDFYHQFNGIDELNHVVIDISEGAAIACGAFKDCGEDAAEVKRMFVLPTHRNQGRARALLADLEAWAREEGFERLKLETGRNQPEAINLYQKCGYIRTPNYGPYVGVDNSLCFEKRL